MIRMSTASTLCEGKHGYLERPPCLSAPPPSLRCSQDVAEVGGKARRGYVSKIYRLFLFFFNGVMEVRADGGGFEPEIPSGLYSATNRLHSPLVCSSRAFSATESVLFFSFSRFFFYIRRLLDDTFI